MKANWYCTVLIAFTKHEMMHFIPIYFDMGLKSVNCYGILIGLLTSPLYVRQQIP